MQDGRATAGSLRGTPDTREIERGILGACMNDSDKVIDLAAEPEEIFSSLYHRQIRNTLVRMWQAQEDIDYLTVAESLQREGIQDKESDLASMCKGSFSLNHLGDIGLLRKNRARRRVLQALTGAMREITEEAKEPEEVAAHASETLAALETPAENGPQQLWPLVNQAIIRAEAANYPESIPTGLASLDRMLGGGLRKKTLTVVAGATSMGKSALSTQIGVYAARRKKKVLIFSLEMSAEALASRIAASEAGVEPHVFRYPRKDIDWKKVRQRTSNLSDFDLFLNDDASLSTEKIALCARQHRMRHGLDLVIVDYLQRVNDVLRSKENRNQLMGQMTRNLAMLAKQIDVAVIAVSQLNRQPGQRQEKKPLLGDIRDSGEIENDADNVIFVHRPGYYDDKADQEEAAIVVAKQREGRTGTFNVRWDGKGVRFLDAEVRYG